MTTALVLRAHTRLFGLAATVQLLADIVSVAIPADGRRVERGEVIGKRRRRPSCSERQPRDLGDPAFDPFGADLLIGRQGRTRRRTRQPRKAGE